MGHLLHVELGLDHPEPEWFDQPAIGQLTIGSFHELASFDTYNRNKSYPQQVRPFGFLTIAHPTASEIGLGSPRSLVAPYEPNPTVAMSQPRWFNRHQPDTTAYRVRTRNPEQHTDTELAVKSYRDYFDTYRRHREAKAAGTDPSSSHWRAKTRRLVEEELDSTRYGVVVTEGVGS